MEACLSLSTGGIKSTVTLRRMYEREREREEGERREGGRGGREEKGNKLLTEVVIMTRLAGGGNPPLTGFGGLVGQ